MEQDYYGEIHRINFGYVGWKIEMKRQESTNLKLAIFVDSGTFSENYEKITINLEN